jgi:hypothetical protein
MDRVEQTIRNQFFVVGLDRQAPLRSYNGVNPVVDLEIPSASEAIDRKRHVKATRV